MVACIPISSSKYHLAGNLLDPFNSIDVSLQVRIPKLCPIFHERPHKAEVQFAKRGRSEEGAK